MSEMAIESDCTIRPITVDEYHRMENVGIFGPEERVELLDGQLIKLPPPGPEHGFSTRSLLETLFTKFRSVAVVDAANSLVLDDFSEPLPDAMLLVWRDDRYRHRLPTAKDALLVIEVAKTSLRYDAGRKLRAYARSGVPEYWIVDLVHRRLERYRAPHDLGYGQCDVFEPGASVAAQAFPDLIVDLADVFP